MPLAGMGGARSFEHKLQSMNRAAQRSGTTRTQPSLAAVHALVWERTLGSLPWRHLVVIRKRN